MGNIVWILIMLPCSMIFTVIGIYAWNSKKPMSFWSGSTVGENEISDIRSYNRANAIMWLCFSVPLWVSTFLGYFYIKTGAVILVIGCILGIPALPVAYGRIYKKYKR
ncbi:MAG: hypothetical protein MJ091_03215 [Clostridia bacterium]|nr:hypothetical protein [Clostridia bacterium]